MRPGCRVPGRPRRYQRARRADVDLRGPLGSWRRKGHNEWLTYRDLAEQLPSYVRDLGFTHIEFLPVSEHPLDGSGYQPTGCRADQPIWRAGGFCRLVDACHREGLGVMLDCARAFS
jgi:1,4-alpha-glucan branching enzyme